MPTRRTALSDRFPLIHEAPSMRGEATLNESITSQAMPSGTLLAAKMLVSRTRMTPRSGPHHRLTRSPVGDHHRERLNHRGVTLLRLLAAGRSNREIAHELGLAESTVKNNLSACFRSIGVHNRAQAARYAFATGLVPALAEAPAKEEDGPIRSATWPDITSSHVADTRPPRELGSDGACSPSALEDRPTGERDRAYDDTKGPDEPAPLPGNCRGDGPGASRSWDTGCDVTTLLGRPARGDAGREGGPGDGRAGGDAPLALLGLPRPGPLPGGDSGSTGGPPGTRYVAAEVGIDNESDQPLNFTPADIRLRDTAGVEYRGGTALGTEPAISPRNMNLSERSRGWVWFTVAAESQFVQLVYAAPQPQLRVDLP